MKNTSNNNQKGFTLVELVVALAIFGIITGIFLVRNQNFGGQILLENLAYDVALSIREAQVFGLSVKEASASPGDFDVAYGVHFYSDLDPANNNKYELFADLDGNNLWSSSETVETFTFKKGFVIGSICGNTQYQSCTGTGSDTTGQVNILFRRPEPEAIINRQADILWTYIEIHVVAPTGNERVVQVLPSGQISVQDATPPE